MSRTAEARAALEEHRRRLASVPPPAPSLFDAREERDEAIARTLDSNRGELLALLDRAVDRVAARSETFTVDDVRDELDNTDLKPGTVDLRVLGGVLRKAAKHGLIRSTGTYVPSRYRHASPLVLWEVVTGA